MDNRILKAILLSCESAWKDLDNSEEYQKLVRDDKFLPTSKNIFNAVCLSLTNLLTYKVSKEAYQRYTVRLHVIDVLRDWCTITDAFRNIRIFTDEKQTSTFLKNLLEKYLTNDVLDTCDLSDNLLPLTSALMCLASTNPYYKHHVERLLLRLLELETSDESERLLCYAVQNSSDLNFELSTIENIYRLQRCKLIEQPLLNYFVSLCSDLNKDNNVDNSESLNLTKQLFEFASKSQCIFLLICAFLKELLLKLEYCPTVMDFIQSTLNLLKKTCQGQGKDILDLYPRDLQSVVILLRIEPAYHTIDSKNATLRILKSIHSEDKNTVIVLISHFPRWLKLFGELLCSYPDVK
ncbi:uncharacterized protein LOC128879980 isoform X1 [Hylaeus volcanicus]|uniref:uncharacterized protein LOC128879980 isoform X1 n=1 Tax=Hylaeus volcanicus TaxID=313075 RepID=UPI0023B7BF03|nr:uncharacterized protein LOC128879980 isoform X1 [Hylaeus volcanicus]